MSTEAKKRKVPRTSYPVRVVVMLCNKRIVHCPMKKEGLKTRKIENKAQNELIIGIVISGKGIIVVWHGSKIKLSMDATNKMTNPKILTICSGKLSFFISIIIESI